MSHGPGKVQRALLEALERRGKANTFTLACDAYGIEPNADGIRLIDEAQLVATRRALIGLAKQHRVFDLGRKTELHGRRIWASQGEGMFRLILETTAMQTGGFLGIPAVAPARVAELKRRRRELIAHAKAMGVWPYVRAKWREMHSQ